MLYKEMLSENLSYKAIVKKKTVEKEKTIFKNVSIEHSYESLRACNRAD